MSFSKTVAFGSDCGFETEYIFKRNEALRQRDFGIEFNLFLASLDHVSVRVGKEEIPAKDPLELAKQKGLIIVDRHNKFELKFKFDEANVFVTPVYSVSSSEGGFERSYQELSVLLVVKDRPQRFKIGFKVEK